MADKTQEHDLAFGSTITLNISEDKVDEVAEFADRHNIALFFDPDTTKWAIEVAANDLNSPEMRMLLDEYADVARTPETQVAKFFDQLRENAIGDTDFEVNYFVAPASRYDFEKEAGALGFSIDLDPVTDEYRVMSHELSDENFEKLALKYDIVDFEEGSLRRQDGKRPIDMMLMVDPSDLSDVARDDYAAGKLVYSHVDGQAFISKHNFTDNKELAETALSVSGGTSIDVLGVSAVVVDDAAFEKAIAGKEGSEISSATTPALEEVSGPDLSQFVSDVKAPRAFVPIAMDEMEDILDIAEALANEGSPAEVAAAKARVAANVSEDKSAAKFIPVSMEEDAGSPERQERARAVNYRSKQTIRREGPQTAAVTAAKAEGREFMALYGLHGLHLAKDKDSPQHIEQMARLRAAPSEEVREMVNVTAAHYRALVEKENSMRLMHAAQHDEYWKSRYDNEVKIHNTDKVKSDAAYAVLMGDFGRLSHEKMKELASIGRGKEGPIKLSFEDLGKMLALDRGFKAMRIDYKEKTGADIGGGIIDFAGRNPDAVKLIDTNVKKTAEEELELRRSKLSSLSRRSAGGVER